MKKQLLVSIILILVLTFVFPTVSPAKGSSSLKTFTLTAVGDVMMHDRQLSSAITDDGTYDLSTYFSLLGDRLSHADVTIANMEAPISPSQPVEGFPHFNAPKEILDLLYGSGVDIVTAINNHTMDQNVEGVLETKQSIEDSGLVSIGIYENEEAFRAPYIRDINGIKVAFLAYTEHINGRERHFKESELVHLIKRYSDEEAKLDIDAAKAAGAEIIVVYMHWGIEYELEPRKSVIDRAHVLGTLGADIILGSHPHVVQPCDMITVTREDGKPYDVFVAYSLGNFISNQRKDYKDNGIIIDLTIGYDTAARKMTILKQEYTPTYVWRQNRRDGWHNYYVVPSDEYKNVLIEGMTESDVRYVFRADEHISSLMENTPISYRGSSPELPPVKAAQSNRIKKAIK